ncbi:MAG: hypothetical protein COA79_19740 [Planctomycetota bacterium]|nr:MAG: hypothetical protein COA79_19740 [Planctomycetota bacterium]
MSFINGSVSAVRFLIAEEIPEKELIKGLKKFVGTDVVLENHPEAVGWCCLENFLDTDIKSEKVTLDNFYLFGFRIASKNVPAALLRAHCQQAEMIALKERGVERLTRYEKSEIKSDLKEDLLEEQPIEYKSFDCLIDRRSGILYFSGTSKRVIKMFIKHFELTFQHPPQLINMETLSSKSLSVKNFKALKNSSPSWFSPTGSDESGHLPMAEFLGPDFLTWLWFQLESNQRVFFSGRDSIGVLIEDFLVLINQSAGPKDSMENIIKNGVPTVCPEAQASLLSGKKLNQCKMMFAIGEKQWSFRYDSLKVSFTGIKLPNVEAEHYIDAQVERFENIIELTVLHDSIFLEFLKELLDDEWGGIVKKIQKWVKNK